MTRPFAAAPRFAAGLLISLMSCPGLYAQCANGNGSSGGCATCGSVGPNFISDIVSDGCCGGGKCPPPYVHTYEAPPRIKFKKACPRPVCEPCNLEHYGYYQTCWAPWPFPADWSHCPVPPPGAVLPPPALPPFTPRTRIPAASPPVDDSRPRSRPSSNPEFSPSRPAPSSSPELPQPRKLGDGPTVQVIE